MMVKAIEFAVRDDAGCVERGVVAGGGHGNVIRVESGDSVSLNLERSSVVSIQQQGDDLVIVLTDGRRIVLDGYFNEVPGDQNHLYLSTNSDMAEVVVAQTTNGSLFVSFGAVESWNEAGQLENLCFGASAAGVVTTSSSGLLGLGLIGTGGTVAAVAGGGALVLSGGGGGGSGRAGPTVDAQSTTTLTTNTLNPQFRVTGTGGPGDTVEVTVGGKIQTTTVTQAGTWGVTFPSTDLPSDGTHAAGVVVSSPPGSTEGEAVTTISLSGPLLVIDMTPPESEVSEGTKSTADCVDAAGYPNGVTISGMGEAGAAIEVTVGRFSQATTVSTVGTWSVTFPPSQLAAGELEIPCTITAMDRLGNCTVLEDTLVIDTIPHSITFDTVTGDNTVNFTESQSGLTITGLSTAGAALTVTLQGLSQQTTVAANGTWSVTFPIGTLPGGGEYSATVTATSTDAAGNVATSTQTFQVDTMTSVGFASAAVATDNIVNAAEAAGGVVLSGTSQPGSSVSVAWNGTTLTTTAGFNGAWSVNFPGTSIPGGTYNSTATVTATDAAGNSASATRSVQVDTQISVAVAAGQVGGDDIISGTEARSGLALTGSAEPGASVAVTFEGTTRTVTAGSNGTWSTTFSTASIPAGSYQSTVLVRATDAAGNTATTTHPVSVDTEVQSFARVNLSAGSDAVLNKVEAAQGLTVTGTVEPGSTVIVSFGNAAPQNASVAANGAWTATIPARDIPAGESSVTLTATATDRVGNVAVLTEQVAVDTEVRNIARLGGLIGGDGVINAAEALNGLALNGTVEPGATVVVRLGSGAELTTLSGSNGTWAVTFPASALPQGDSAISVTMTATDRAGNVTNLTDIFAIDTELPSPPSIVSFSSDSSGLRGITDETSADQYSFVRIDASGNTTTVSAILSADPLLDETNFRFGSAVPNGSYLVINAVDTAGNDSSSLLIVDSNRAPEVNLSRPGLGAYDFSAIDLTFAPNSDLRITEAQLRNLTGPDHQLMIKGDVDDSVSLVGGVDSGQTRSIEGETYRLYTLGTAASVLIDDDILTTMSLV